MTTRHLVSVIIPFANSARFLEEAIGSVLAQTYACWELILVDDGAGDGSTEIARRYATRLADKIRYLEHDGHANWGVCVSRNLGIRYARGEYIAFLDADDVWLPGKLARQTAILQSEPDAAMVYGPSQYWYSWTGRPEDVARDRVNSLAIAPGGLVKPPALLISSLRGRSYPPNPSNLLVRREVLQRIGGFDESWPVVRNVRSIGTHSESDTASLVSVIQPYEDQAFVAKVHLKEVVFVSDECWDRYRKHENSSVSVMKRTGTGQAAQFYYLKWLQKYLASEGLSSGGISKALRRAFWRHRHPTVTFLLERSGRRIKEGLLMRVTRHAMPRPFRAWLRARWERRPYCPPPGWVRFGSLRRATPISRSFGSDRGLPVDRFYIERFLGSHAEHIRGRVLEIGDAHYTRTFGGDRVTDSDVLHVEPGSPGATIVGDLTAAEPDIPSDTFDCIILTQTLPVIYDLRAAIRTLHRILAPGGTVLATVGGISQISRWDMDRWGHFWSFTTLSAQRLFEEAFAPGHVAVQSYGSVLSATAFLHGVAAHELLEEELAYWDRDYQVLIGVCAVKERNQ